MKYNGRRDFLRKTGAYATRLMGAATVAAAGVAEANTNTNLVADADISLLTADAPSRLAIEAVVDYSTVTDIKTGDVRFDHTNPDDQSPDQTGADHSNGAVPQAGVLLTYRFTGKWSGRLGALYGKNSVSATVPAYESDGTQGTSDMSGDLTVLTIEAGVLYGWRPTERLRIKVAGDLILRRYDADLSGDLSMPDRSGDLYGDMSSDWSDTVFSGRLGARGEYALNKSGSWALFLEGGAEFGQELDFEANAPITIRGGENFSSSSRITNLDDGKYNVSSDSVGFAIRGGLRFTPNIRAGRLFTRKGRGD